MLTGIKIAVDCGNPALANLAHAGVAQLSDRQEKLYTDATCNAALLKYCGPREHERARLDEYLQRD
jgi:hypothetical protein